MLKSKIINIPTPIIIIIIIVMAVNTHTYIYTFFGQNLTQIYQDLSCDASRHRYSDIHNTTTSNLTPGDGGEDSRGARPLAAKG